MIWRSVLIKGYNGELECEKERLRSMKKQTMLIQNNLSFKR